MVHNYNAITKYAEGHLTVDETTWGHAGYGEAGSGLKGRLMNKKVNRGGQTTIMTDSRMGRSIKVDASTPRLLLHESDCWP